MDSVFFLENMAQTCIFGRFFSGYPMDSYLMNTYQPLAVNLTHGNGVHVTDDQGVEYLDALCGISVTSLGHNHPEITRSIREQSEKNTPLLQPLYHREPVKAG